MMRIIKLFLLVFVLTLVLPQKHPLATNNSKMSIHFLDVGQSDSIFIEVIGGKNMLIDAGNNQSGPKIVQYLQRLGVNKIDYIVSTHPHHDHIGSLDDIIVNFSIGKLYTSNVTHDTASFYDVLKAIKKYKISVHNVKKEKKLKLAEDISVEIIGPLVDSYASINEQSIIVHLVHLDKSFLFMADAGIPAEKKLLLKKKNLKADVLKLGHHGADSASSNTFIKKVKPEIAVITVGKNNSYHYPSTSVLRTLQNHYVKVLRTDQLGTITALSNGKKIIWFTSKFGFIYPK
jgi:competence protein ComEC